MHILTLSGRIHGIRHHRLAGRLKQEGNFSQWYMYKTIQLQKGEINTNSVEFTAHWHSYAGPSRATCIARTPHEGLQNKQTKWIRRGTRRNCVNVAGQATLTGKNCVMGAPGISFGAIWPRGLGAGPAFYTRKERLENLRDKRNQFLNKIQTYMRSYSIHTVSRINKSLEIKTFDFKQVVKVENHRSIRGIIY